jgi:hypothetical protein
MLSELLEPETEVMLSIAETIAGLSLSHLGAKNALDFNSALSSINLYRKTFGEDGFNYLESRIDSLSLKYGYYEPMPEGVKEVNGVVQILENIFILNHVRNEPAALKEFTESERKEISAFTENRRSVDSLTGQKQSGSAALGAVKNINSKEKIMPEKQAFRPSIDAGEKNAKEEAFINALSQRKNIISALQNGTLSCLPGADGYADTVPAVNLVSGTNYHGANLLYLKDHQKQNDFPTAEYITENQIKNAIRENPGLSVKPEEKPVFIHWSEENEETKKYEHKSVKLFNVAQTSDPEGFKTYFAEKKQEEYQQWLEKKQIEKPGYQPPEPKPKKPGPDIECTSTEPEKYLGQYLAAVSMGGRFKASPEQAAEFSQKLENTMYEKMDNGYPNPFMLSKISNNASQYCKDVTQEVRMAMQKDEYHQQQEQKQEQTQSLGRGR